jgi:CBS domain containing-hemolysin-like protein
MNGTDWVILVAVVLLFVFSVVLAVAETAFVRISLPRARSLLEEDRRGAARLVHLLEQPHPETTLNVVLLVVLISQMSSAFLLGFLVGDLAGVWGALASIAVQIVAFFVLAEAAPKTWVLQHTDTAALRATPLLTFLTWFPPLRLLARGLIGLSNIVLPGKGIKEGPFVTELEIREMADLAADELAIDSEERELIHSIFEFGDAVVREVMTPRNDMVAVSSDKSVEDVIGVGINEGFSRLPVYEESTDNIVGVAILKDLVRARETSGGADAVGGYVRPVRFVPEQKRLAELLKEMQAEKFHIAVVVDEYGGNAGLVTLEDLIEELVGEITDESDVVEPEMERLPDGTLRAPGRTPIDDVSEELGVVLPDTEWDTVAGLVFHALGHVPDEGESVDFDGVTLCAERVQGNRIVSVLIAARPAEPDEVEPESTDGSGT